MDLGSINEKLLHNLQRTQIEQIALISKSLGLKIGSQLLAQADKVTQATPDDVRLLQVIVFKDHF